MKTMLYLWQLSMLLLLVSCGQDLIEIGTEGGECRLTPTPCDEGLICTAGKCVADNSITAPDLSVILDLSKRTLFADGQDELDIQLLVNLADDDTPFNGVLLIYTEPSGVGTLSVNLLTIEDGFGVVTYRSCDRRSAVICPEVLTFKLALPESPNDPIFESLTIRQLSSPVESPTRLETDACRAAVGTNVGLTIPTEPTEIIEASAENSWSGLTDSLQLSTTSLSLTLPLPDQRVNSYHVLAPEMIQAAITMATDAMQDTDEAMEAILSSCLLDGVWVGHQRLEFWVDEDAEGNALSHVLSIIELDCIDDTNGYAVIRACAHGTH